MGPKSQLVYRDSRTLSGREDMATRTASPNIVLTN